MTANRKRTGGTAAERGGARAGFVLASGAVLLVAAGSAHAAPLVGDFYLAVNGGVNAIETHDIIYSGDVLPPLRASFEAGWVGSGAIGWRMRDFFRVEFEGAYRENQANEIDGISAGGRMKTTTAMVNGYFDFPTYEGVIPHIGVGLGRAQLIHQLQVQGIGLADASGHAFAYQAIGGLEFPIVSYRVAATVEYRYLGTAHASFRDDSGFYYRYRDYNHAFMLGLRWAL